MPIKVCHFTSVHPAKDGRIFYKECTSLVKAGYDVTLIVANTQNEVHNGVKIIGVPIRKVGRLHRILTVGKDVYHKALEIDADIYHFHDPELLPFALRLKRRGKKVIFDSHEFVGKQILTKTYISKPLRKLISNIYQKIETYICIRIDAVIEVCTLNGKDYFEHRCKRRIFLTNAPIINKNTVKKDINRYSLNNVVHIGSLTEERGITYLGMAISKLKCKLILAGPFSSKEYENEIKHICGNQLEYKGILPPSEIPTLLEECGIGICTLLDKGQYSSIDILPTKIYDYMLAGIPVIMSDFPFLKEFNEKYNIGLCVSPDDPKAISEAINYLLTHPAEAVKMGNNGRELVLKEFNWDSQEKILIELYEDLIKNN